MAEKLCLRCGAYWGCDCVLDEWGQPVDAACVHDWADAVGVEVFEDVDLERVRVRICRLCGLYAVSERSETDG